MAVTLTGTGGLFTRLGKLIGGIRNINGMRGETAAVGNVDDASALWGSAGAAVKDAKTQVTDILAQYLSTRQSDVADIWTAQSSFRSSLSGYISTLKNYCQTTLIGMVDDDAILPTKDVPTAMAELIRQMVAGGTFINAANDVDANTVSASVAAQTQPANTGNATIVATVRGVQGYSLENVFAENIEVTVTNDSNLSATAGSEPLSVKGEVAAQDALDWVFPSTSPHGSNGSASISMVDPLQNNAGNNTLYNSCFDAFTVANTPDYWGIVVGAAGTDIFSEASVIYRSTGKALKFTGTGAAPLSSIMQKFNVSSPTTSTSSNNYAIKPNTVYLVNCYAKDSGAGLAAGTVKIELCDQAGTPAVVNDDQGTANSISIAAASTTGTYAAFSGVFVTPKVLPSTGLQLAVRVTTALTNGESMYIDDLAMYEVPTNQIYTRGPSVAAFRGSTDVAIGDKWNVTIANDFGGLFQTYFEPVFSMRSMGLQLPSDTAAGETIADSLIS